VNSPPAARPRDIRLSPADGIALLRQRYDLRAADGLLICTVTRDAAARQIAAGVVELRQGRSGAYLQPVAREALPEGRTYQGGRRTWHGPVRPGVEGPARYAHADQVCAGYQVPKAGDQA